MRRVARGLVHGGSRLNPQVWAVGEKKHKYSLKYTEYIAGGK